MKISVKLKPNAKEDRIEKISENQFSIWVKARSKAFLLFSKFGAFFTSTIFPSCLLETHQKRISVSLQVPVYI